MVGCPQAIRHPIRERISLGLVDERKRAAAVIVRDGRVLMVHERSRRATGGEWWTLPGGGIGPDESAEQAMRREVLEETGLIVLDARPLLEMPYPAGMTSVFSVTVADGEAYLGADPGDGPQPIGLDWVPLPDVDPATHAVPVPPMIVAVPVS
jgi:8-oxo-dGTP diphosphatase